MVAMNFPEPAGSSPARRCPRVCVLCPRLTGTLPRQVGSGDNEQENADKEGEYCRPVMGLAPRAAAECRYRLRRHLMCCEWPPLPTRGALSRHR